MYLNYNKISEVGVEKIAEALKINTTLQELYLNGNRIKEVGIIALIQAINENKTLQKLYFLYNYFHYKELQKFVNNETITLSDADFFRLLDQLKDKYNILENIENESIYNIEINLEDKTLRIVYDSEKEPSTYQFEGNCPYFDYETKYYVEIEHSISLIDYINILKESNSYTRDISSLPNNEDIDYLEYIIKKHFNKVNLNNNLNEMKQINYKK